jgi:hypothetical protein
MNRHFLAVPAALAAAAVLAAPASADVIKPGVRMAGLKVGEPVKQVRAAYGKPDKIVRNADNAYTYVYKQRRLTVAFQNDTVEVISSKSRLDQTDNGLGRGSTLAQLRKGLFNEKCTGNAKDAYCEIFTRNLKRHTGFAVRNGKVIRIDVGIILVAIPFE